MCWHPSRWNLQLWSASCEDRPTRCHACRGSGERFKPHRGCRALPSGHWRKRITHRLWRGALAQTLALAS
jgi:hypothetical protein